MPVQITAPQTASKLVVDTVDQPEVPSGIEPGEIRVPQDGEEPRSLLANKDSPLPSDESSDLNTQPSERSNKGGRPPAADWEALKDALVEEIKTQGYPDRQNLPGWRGTKDVADWIVETFPKEVKRVSRRTIEHNVRRIIRELKAASAKPVSR